MPDSKRPSIDLARRVLPAGLFEAIELIFSAQPAGVILVGGTALAGFYAGHRRSDDIDLFCEDIVAQRSAILAVKALTQQGATLSSLRETPHYFHCLASLSGHQFTIDIVLDHHLKDTKVGVPVSKGIIVASLTGLLCMKIATLVSRCSEKDLYDLIWLFGQWPGLSLSQLVPLGSKIDLGVSEESILISLSGATLTKSACSFAAEMGHSVEDVFQQISLFRKQLIIDYSAYLRNKAEKYTIKSVLDKLSKR